jgi:RNA polymerase sigma factor (sigma-70 family)
MSDRLPVVYVVDDDASVRKALMRLFRVAGLHAEAFATAQDFLDHRQVQTTCCLVLDVRLPDQSGLDLQQELRARGCHIPIVFITGHGTVPLAVQAMRSGAVHFLPKPFDNRDLLAAVRQAIERDRRLHVQQEESQEMEGQVAALTPREREVFLLVADGLANKNIATRLGISLQTVKVHRGRVMQKLQATSVADLVRVAERIKAVLPGL